MANDAMSRRRMLVGAGGAAAAAGATLALSPSVAGAQDVSTADDHEHRQGLIGTWEVTHTDDPVGTSPGDVGVATISFVPGGVLVTHELNPPGPPGQGAWERTGRDSFVFRFLSSGLQGPPEPGSSGPPPVFVLTVDASGTLSEGHISGTYSLRVTGGDGDELQTGTGEFTGTRVSATG
jgi:hypothetical protein